MFCHYFFSLSVAKTKQKEQMADPLGLPWLFRVLLAPHECVPLMLRLLSHLHETYQHNLDSPPILTSLLDVLDVCVRHRRYEPLPMLFFTMMRTMESLADMTKQQLVEHGTIDNDEQWKWIMAFVYALMNTFGLAPIRRDNANALFEQFNEYARAVLVQQRYAEMVQFVDRQRERYTWPEHFEYNVTSARDLYGVYRKATTTTTTTASADGAPSSGAGGATTETAASSMLIDQTTAASARGGGGAGGGGSANFRSSAAYIAAEARLSRLHALANQQALLHTLSEKCVDDKQLVESVVAYRTDADIVE
jgi:hypothetical protein